MISINCAKMSFFVTTQRFLDGHRVRQLVDTAQLLWDLRSLWRLLFLGFWGTLGRNFRSSLYVQGGVFQNETWSPQGPGGSVSPRVGTSLWDVGDQLSESAVWAGWSLAWASLQPELWERRS